MQIDRRMLKSLTYIFKGIPGSNRRLSEWLEYLAFRKAFQFDRISLSSQDVLSLSLETNDDGKKKDDLSEEMLVNDLAPNRLFEVSLEVRL